MDNNKATASVGLVWQLATGSPEDLGYGLMDVHDIANKMYPGKFSNVWWSEIYQIRDEYVLPQLHNHFSNIKEFETAQEAIEALGEKVEIPVIEPLK